MRKSGCLARKWDDASRVGELRVGDQGLLIVWPSSGMHLPRFAFRGCPLQRVLSVRERRLPRGAPNASGGRRTGDVRSVRCSDRFGRAVHPGAGGLRRWHCVRGIYAWNPCGLRPNDLRQAWCVLRRHGLVLRSWARVQPAERPVRPARNDARCCVRRWPIRLCWVPRPTGMPRHTADVPTPRCRGRALRCRPRLCGRPLLHVLVWR